MLEFRNSVGIIQNFIKFDNSSLKKMFFKKNFKLEKSINAAIASDQVLGLFQSWTNFKREGKVFQSPQTFRV